MGCVPRRVGIQVVIEGKILALELLGLEQARSGLAGAEAGVGARLLVRILAVLGHRRDAQSNSVLTRKASTVAEAVEVFGDQGVVGRDVTEGLCSQLSPALQREVASPEMVHDVVVILRVGNDGHRGEVLGGGTDHGGATDVDLLDDVDLFEAVLLDRALERVEVHDEDVDRDDAVLVELAHVIIEVAAGQEATMDARVQRLDPAVKHLR